MVVIRGGRIAVFLLIAFGLAYALGFGYFAAGGSLVSPKFLLMGIAYMFTPALAAVVTQRFVAREPLRELGLNAPRWKILLGAWLAPLLIVLVALALSLLQPGVTLQNGLAALFQQLDDKLPPERLALLHQQLDHSALAQPGVLPLIMLAQVLAAGATINALAAFGEELGWRGFLLKEMAPLGFWLASFLIGVIWGLWHLPLIVYGYNYPGHPVAGPLMMTLLTILLAPLLSHFRLRGGSVFVPAVFHGTFNAAASLALLLHNGNPMLNGATGWTGMVTLAGADLLLWFWIRRRSILELQAPALPKNRLS